MVVKDSPDGSPWDTARIPAREPLSSPLSLRSSHKFHTLRTLQHFHQLHQHQVWHRQNLQLHTCSYRGWLESGISLWQPDPTEAGPLTLRNRRNTWNWATTNVCMQAVTCLNRGCWINQDQHWQMQPTIIFCIRQGCCWGPSACELGCGNPSFKHPSTGV